MYRQDSWADGFYQDNLEKYECNSCNKTFIVGRELLKQSKLKEPFCPYCKASGAEWRSGTEDEQLEELGLGCIGLYIDQADN